jgi:hypothetical protein
MSGEKESFQYSASCSDCEKGENNSLMISIQGSTKWLLSFTKSTWSFQDYPIRTWRNPNAGTLGVAFGAGIINWSLMVGHGETPAKAVKALKERFELYRDNNPNLPRPGS